MTKEIGFRLKRNYTKKSLYLNKKTKLYKKMSANLKRVNLEKKRKREMFGKQ